MNNEKQIIKIWFCGVISVIIVLFIYNINYFFLPASLWGKDADSNINLRTEIVEDKIDYIFTLNGIRIKVNKTIIKPELGYTGKSSFVNVATDGNRYYLLLPISWKNLSYHGIYKKILQPVKRNVSSTVISINEIREQYQKIDINTIKFYKMDGIKRLIHENLDTFKIVIFSYSEEVEENELYWNKKDSYYYLISPEDGAILFEKTEE